MNINCQSGGGIVERWIGRRWRIVVGASLIVLCFKWGGGLLFSQDAKKITHAAAAPRIAVVIDDFGLNYKKDIKDEEWLKLPFTMTFALLPKSPTTRALVDPIKKSGKELIIHFPFDPFLKLELPKGDTPSPKDTKKVKALLEEALKEIPGPKGLNNHRSLHATENPALMRWFMREFKPLGLYFLDSRVGPHTVAYREARKAGVPTTMNGLFLDGTREAKARRSKDPKVLAEAIQKDKVYCLGILRQVASRARRKGTALTIGHHYWGGTYECLKEGIPQLQKEGFEFVFASQLAK